jgi:hypothetical protein
MPPDPSLRLVLAPLADEGRIAGRLRDERGQEHLFSSWVGLLSLLDAARLRAGRAAQAPSASPSRKVAGL